MRHTASARLHDDTLVSARGLTWVLALLHLLDDEFERLDHVLAVPRAGLGPCALELVGQRSAFFGLDLPLLGSEVGFVAHNDEGNGFGALGCERVSFGLSAGVMESPER